MLQGIGRRPNHHDVKSVSKLITNYLNLLDIILKNLASLNLKNCKLFLEKAYKMKLLDRNPYSRIKTKSKIEED